MQISTVEISPLKQQTRWRIKRYCS